MLNLRAFKRFHWSLHEKAPVKRPSMKPTDEIVLFPHFLYILSTSITTSLISLRAGLTVKHIVIMNQLTNSFQFERTKCCIGK